jgi:hypothetical protein
VINKEGLSVGAAVNSAVGENVGIAVLTISDSALDGLDVG